jgi:ankyrin repeat protein
MTKQEIFDDATAKHNITIVSELLNDKKINIDNSLFFSCVNGYFDIVELLIQDERINALNDYNDAIRLAAEYGHTNIVTLLLNDKRIDPSTLYDLPVRVASENGHIEVVKLLLEDSRVNPSDINNQAIKQAFAHEHFEIVDILFKIKIVNENLKKQKPSVYNSIMKKIIQEKIREF